jgi:prophage maintenance system killer protein
LPDSAARTVCATEARWNRHWHGPRRVTTKTSSRSLWESLSQNHPFIDGNKRISITVTAAFLRVNGYRLQFDDLDAYRFLMDLYETGRFRFKELDGWLRSHVIKLP